MTFDLRKNLKEAPRADLIIAAEILRARRNGRLFFAMVAAAIIGWRSWNQLLLLVPGVIALYAAIPQVNLCLIAAELKRRRSEGKTAAHPAPEDDTQMCEDSDCDLEQIESELSRIRHDVYRADSEEEKQILRERLVALKARLDAPQLRRELNVESVRLEMARDLQEQNPNGYREDLFPTFDEWLSDEGHGGARGTDRASLLISYCDELERRYNHELAQLEFEETRRCATESDGGVEESFDLDSVIARAEVNKNKGESLAQEERGEFEHIVRELEETEKKIAEAEQVCEAGPTVDLKQESPEQKHYRGIRRLGYFLGMLGAGALCEMCNMTASSQFGVAWVGSLIALVISFILTVNRLRNIGMDEWPAIFIFVPLANIYIGIKCLICQEGYQDVKKLDTTGRMIVGISIGLILGVILLGVGNLLIDTFVRGT
jgi:uncharacterized membrane protein YhaH (DUF805 family)